MSARDERALSPSAASVALPNFARGRPPAGCAGLRSERVRGHGEPSELCRACHENGMDMMRTMQVDQAAVVGVAVDVKLEEESHLSAAHACETGRAAYNVSDSG